jgi:hypothetical protein
MNNSIDKLITNDELLTYICLIVGIANIIYFFRILRKDAAHYIYLFLVFEFLFIIFIIYFFIKKKDIYKTEDVIEYNWYFYLRVIIIIYSFACFILYIIFVLSKSASNDINTCGIRSTGGTNSGSRIIVSKRISNFISSSIVAPVAKLYKRVLHKNKYLESELEDLNNELNKINNLIKTSDNNKKRRNYNIRKLAILEKIKNTNYSKLLEFRNKYKLLLTNNNLLNNISIDKRNYLTEKHNYFIGRNEESITNLKNFIEEVSEFNKKYQEQNTDYLQIQKDKIIQKINKINDQLKKSKIAENEKKMKRASNKIQPSSSAVSMLNKSQQIVSSQSQNSEQSPISPISPISPQSLTNQEVLSDEELRKIENTNKKIYTHLTRFSSKLPEVNEQELDELSK